MFIIVLSFCAFFLPLLSDVKLYFFYHFLFETKINKKTWETLNIYFSNKLQFERKLYYYRPGLTTRETKMRVVGMRSFIFWLKQERPLALRLCEWAAKRFWFFGPYLPKKGITCRKQKKWTPPLNSAYLN